LSALHRTVGRWLIRAELVLVENLFVVAVVADVPRCTVGRWLIRAELVLVENLFVIVSPPGRRLVVAWSSPGRRLVAL
jgi:hypothetical protein